MTKSIQPACIVGRGCSDEMLPSHRLDYPVCLTHAIEIRRAVEKTLDDMFVHRPAQLRQRAKRNAHSEVTTGVVYYIDRGDRVKIGWTNNLAKRMAALVAAPHDLLATEPGTMTMETRRHHEFAHLRCGKQELFRKAPDLMSHIEALQRNTSAA